MVSSLTAVRIWSQQTALNAFKEASDARASGQSSSDAPGRSLADILYAGSNDDDGYEDTSLATLIATLQRQAAMGGKVNDPADSDGLVEDISSKAFMKALLDKLETLKASADTRAMAETMLKTIEAGTMTVRDAAAGEQIQAWDLSGTESGAPEKTSVDKTDWSSFLKERLTRDSSGRYLRNEDSSHKDKTAAVSSYFGMIGDTYYYLSWTEPGAEKPGVSIQI